eukprot:2588052-Prymnesium_polylepis.1
MKATVISCVLSVWSVWAPRWRGTTARCVDPLSWFPHLRTGRENLLEDSMQPTPFSKRRASPFGLRRGRIRLRVLCSGDPDDTHGARPASQQTLGLDEAWSLELLGVLQVPLLLHSACRAAQGVQFLDDALVVEPQLQQCVH